MSAALAKIWARRIYAGEHTLTEVKAKYGKSGENAVKQAYYELFGKEI